MAEFRLLGDVRLSVGSREVPLGPPKQRTVLAALLVDAGRTVRSDTLVDRIWDECPPAEARSALYTHITRIRRVLRQVGEQPGRLARRGGGYALELDPGQVDWHRYRRLVEIARDPLADDHRRAELLREALKLWQGEPLADLSGSWVSAVRESWRRQHLGAVTTWARAELRLGNHMAVVDRVRDLAREYPLDEPLTEALMRALQADGRTAEALDRYTELRRRLADELGADPGSELQRLHQAILRGELAAATTTTSPPGTPATPAQLPADVAGFAGRSGELKELDRVLVGGDGRATAVVVTAICGTAGVGKTALAVHWAHRVRDRFGDGQLYVDLRGYHPAGALRPIEALARFLHALGVSREQVPVDVEEAAALYRSRLAGRRMLVVLDNAASPEQVRSLLPGTSGCVVLVTSRDDLGGLVARDGAHRLSIDVLPAGEAHAMLTQLLGRARTAVDPAAVAEVARRCAYLPLALRIAAAHLLDDDRYISDYVARLAAGDPLSALEVPDDPQTAVRAAFELSYNRLAPPARRMFRLLGLNPGRDIGIAAAAAVADLTADQAAQLLQRLASAHLLIRARSRRYSFHDLLRAYAAELVHAEESQPQRDAAIGRLYGHYLLHTELAARRLYPEMLHLPERTVADRPAPARIDGTHEDALTWLDLERPNLVAAVTEAAAHGPQELACRLANALRGYLSSGMFTMDWLTTGRAGLAAAEATGDLPAQAAAHFSLAQLSWRRSEYPPALERCTQALALADRAGWAEGQAAALGGLGVLYAQLGRLAHAAAFHVRAIAANQRAGQCGGMATSLANLADILRDQGQLQLAAERYTRALDTYRAVNSMDGEAYALNGLGETLHELGRVQEALDHLLAAAALHRRIGNRSYEAYDLRCLAMLHCDAGRHQEALGCAQAALALARVAEDLDVEADALTALGTIHHRLGDHQQAVDHHRRALRLAHHTRNRPAEIDAHIGLAVALDGCEEAIAHAERGLTLARHAGYLVRERRALTALERAHAGRRDRE
jgi:DNA-binding SARP family transcriptional activator